VGCAGVLNGVEVNTGVAVCVGEELAVGVGVWAEAVGVGDCDSAVPVAVAVAVAEASGVLGKCHAAEHRAEQAGAAEGKGEDLLESHEASYTRVERSRDGGDSAQLRHCAPRA
jgi:hypothetical protein